MLDAGCCRGHHVVDEGHRVAAGGRQGGAAVDRRGNNEDVLSGEGGAEAELPGERVIENKHLNELRAG